MKTKKRYIDSGRRFTYKSQYLNDDPNKILCIFKDFLEEMKTFKKIKNLKYSLEQQENSRWVMETDEEYEQRVAENNIELDKKRILLEEQAKQLGMKIKPKKPIVLNRKKVNLRYPDLPNNVTFDVFCENLINHLEKYKDIDIHGHYISMHILINFDGKTLESDHEYNSRVYHERRANAKLMRSEKENKIMELKILARQIGVDLVEA
jgi:tRNA G10  N-methylase Trm11